MQQQQNHHVHLSFFQNKNNMSIAQLDAPVVVGGKASCDMVYGAAKDMDNMVVQIVSKENILPASPTPDNLRIFKLSVLDQTQLDLYIPLLLFYLNDQTSNLDTVISDRLKLLKQGLSETLVRFYPFAGKVKDNLHIDCNDEGVYYVETRVNTRLSDFLTQSPGDELIHKLIPENARESPLGNYLLMMQVNIFSCGGIVICTCINHKFIDGGSYSLFLKDWSAATRGSSDVVYPNFDAPALFPQIPSLTIGSVAPPRLKFATQRFVFDISNIAALKSQIKLSSGSEPTRFEAISALLWKCAAKATYKVNKGSVDNPFNLGTVLNLRGTKGIPKNSVGNLVWPGYPQSKLETILEGGYLVDEIKKCKGQLSDELVAVLMGDGGTPTIYKVSEMMTNRFCFSLWITGMLNMDFYYIDFGWGKPIWFYYFNLYFPNCISLCDTKEGGVQAVTSFTEEEMTIIENDPELLAFASVNPSPI